MCTRTVIVLLAACLLSSVGAVQYEALNSKLSPEQFGTFDLHQDRYARQSSEQNETIMDDHTYYTSNFYSAGRRADELWVDITQDGNIEEILEAEISDRFRYYMIHSLPFSFPFYGHVIDSVAITTGGFLYTGTYYHEFIHLTQYIAPLQADFNPELNDTAKILISSTPDRFTVQWDEVHNNDHVDVGTFTFQVNLYPNGTIVFAYRNIPLSVSEISAMDHPVEVGLSDSFYVDQIFPGSFVVRSIYEYHRVELSSSPTLSNTSYVLTPLPNCITAMSCDECQNMNDISTFDCEWCSSLQRCSDGIDRFRQEWFTSGCVDSASTQCPLNTGAAVGIAVGGLALVLIGVLVGVCIGVFVYGYRTPTSKLGMYMIEHRPGARTLNKTSSSAAYSVESAKTILEEET